MFTFHERGGKMNGPSIVITEEMIEAGIEAIGPLDRDLYDMSSREKLAAIVSAAYRAMYVASMRGETTGPSAETPPQSARR